MWCLSLNKKVLTSTGEENVSLMTTSKANDKVFSKI